MGDPVGLLLAAQELAGDLLLGGRVDEDLAQERGRALHGPAGLVEQVVQRAVGTSDQSSHRASP